MPCNYDWSMTKEAPCKDNFNSIDPGNCRDTECEHYAKGDDTMTDECPSDDGERMTEKSNTKTVNPTRYTLLKQGHNSKDIADVPQLADFGNRLYDNIKHILYVWMDESRNYTAGWCEVEEGETKIKRQCKPGDTPDPSTSLTAEQCIRVLELFKGKQYPAGSLVRELMDRCIERLTAMAEGGK